MKLLDAGQRLPVHVHPTRAFASRHLGCPYGKTEAWYILQADDDAAVWVGWREEVEPERLSALVDAQDTEAMLALMHRIPVRPGDGVLVPGGTPHAIGQGVLLVEAQEPTDQSILLERVNTTASDAEIFLGLDREVALSAVDPRRSPTSGTDAARRRRRRTDAGAARSGGGVLPHGRALAGGRRARGLRRRGGAVRHGVTDGRRDGEPIAVTRANTLVVPASSGEWHVEGDVRLLVCRPGESWPPPRTPDTREGTA